MSLQCGEGEADACLSPTEIAAARRIYAGVRNEAGDVLFPGTGPGSEGEWAFYASPDFRIGTSYFRNVVANDPDWDPATLDVDKDLDRAERQDGGAADAMDPDLSAFIARGGKLLAYHGTTDGLIPYGNSVRYHESVVERLGNVTVEDSVKLYLVAGMDHCYGGEGAYEVDWLAALEAWVEDGKEPSALPAAHPAAEPGSPRFTRPVCPYPQTATYSGSGDPGDAANFECVEP